MKITAIVPPVFDRTKKPAERTAGCTRIVYPAPNVYELVVLALLEREGFDVSYRDFVFGNEKVADLEKFLASDTSDVYTIWSVNLAIEDDTRAIGMIRRMRPGAAIVVMGPAPTYFLKQFLVDGNIYAVRGEPDMTTLELMQALRDGRDVSGIKGLSYLRGGKIVNNPTRPLIKDLDSLPFASRRHLEGRVYHNPKLKTGPYTTLITSRNCPYRCIYCVPSSLTFAREIESRRETGHKPAIGFRSPENVGAELKMLHEQGYRAVGFMDDNFIWNEERTAAIARYLKEYGMAWGCQARVDAITEPIARILSESGCRYVDLGIESFNDDILKFIKKGITSEDIVNAITLLHKYKVPVKLNVLIGSSPLETKETIRHTQRCARRLPADQVMFNIVSPFPGTEFHDMAIKNGWILGGQYRPTDVQRESILNYPHLSAREMERALFRNNLRYFLSPKFVFKQLRRFRTWSEFRAAAKGLKRKLFG